MQTKETVKAVLDRLPDDCSLDDVLYHLYVVQAVARGRAEDCYWIYSEEIKL